MLICSRNSFRRRLDDQVYVDDLGMTAESDQEIKTRTNEADEILEHANMFVKKWSYSGVTDGLVDMGESESLSNGEDKTEGVLGVQWDAKRDIFKFKVRINLSPLKQKSRTGPDLSKEDLLSNPPENVTRRQFYSVIQSLFDPLGLLTPTLLTGKLIYMYR